jgi:hypothetical protein
MVFYKKVEKSEFFNFDNGGYFELADFKRWNGDGHLISSPDLRRKARKPARGI